MFPWESRKQLTPYFLADRQMLIPNLFVFYYLWFLWCDKLSRKNLTQMNLFLLSQTNWENFGVLASARILHVSKHDILIYYSTCSRAILKSIVSMIEIRLYQFWSEITTSKQQWIKIMLDKTVICHLGKHVWEQRRAGFNCWTNNVSRNQIGTVLTLSFFRKNEHHKRLAFSHRSRFW